VLYPVTPWLAMMMLGWAFGNHLIARRESRRALSPARMCGVAGAASLLLFALVRGWNGYGNMLLGRRDGSLVEWLHVSKYPPSLAYASLELGVMAVCLAWLFLLQARTRRVWNGNPVLVLGQTALFFYLNPEFKPFDMHEGILGLLIHVPVLVGVSLATAPQDPDHVESFFS